MNLFEPWLVSVFISSLWGAEITNDIDDKCDLCPSLIYVIIYPLGLPGSPVIVIRLSVDIHHPSQCCWVQQTHIFTFKVFESSSPPEQAVLPLVQSPTCLSVCVSGAALSEASRLSAFTSHAAYFRSNTNCTIKTSQHRRLDPPMCSNFVLCMLIEPDLSLFLKAALKYLTWLDSLTLFANVSGGSARATKNTRSQKKQPYILFVTGLFVCDIRLSLKLVPGH